MTFNFKNMNPNLRQTMVAEIQNASASGNFYFSTRFNTNGLSNAVNLLVLASSHNDEHWLAYEIESRILMKEYETRQNSLGVYTAAHVPHTAAETYAEGQFNRYYMIAVCLEAISLGKNVSVYRAKIRSNSKPSSEQLIGSMLNPQILMSELRNMNSSLRHSLLTPNSGLSIEIL